MIETLGEWNTRLGYCGCCLMPECPTPDLEIEFMTASGKTVGHKDDDTPEGPFNLNLWVRYLDEVNTVTQTFSYTVGPEGQLNEKEVITSELTAEYSRITYDDNAKIIAIFNVVNPVETTTCSGGGTSTSTFSRDFIYGDDAIGDGTGFPSENLITSESTTVSTHVGGVLIIPDPDDDQLDPNAPDQFHASCTWRKVSTDKQYHYVGSPPDNEPVPADPPFTETVDEESFSDNPFLPEPAGDGENGVIENESYENDYSWEQWLEATLPRVEAALSESKTDNVDFWDDFPVFNSSEHSVDEPFDYSMEGTISLRAIRFRFRVPSEHEGNKFTFIYDIAEFLVHTIDDPDYEPPNPLPDPAPPIPQIPDPNPPPPTFVSQDNIIEWTGPGTQIPDENIVDGEVVNQEAIDAAEDTWYTSYVEVDPPTVPGEHRVVNIRFTCYTGTKYGVKPQVMGEALELEEPEP